MIRLLRYGIKGFLKKALHPLELQQAIETVVATGFYHSPYVQDRQTTNTGNDEWSKEQLRLNDTEQQFIKLCQSDLTNRDIAREMGLTLHGMNTLTNQLFEKLGVQSRVGLIMVTTRNKLVSF